MRYRITLTGLSPLIMHNGVAGLDTRSPESREKLEIHRKKASNRSEEDEARLRELECQTSFWLGEDGLPTINPLALRAVIEDGARKVRQGAQVREGLQVEAVEVFAYDVDRYGTTLKELSQTCQFTVPVVVQRSRIMRTRARFETPWAVTFTVDCDDELVDQEQLGHWLIIAGKRIGLGDWRPSCSGQHGRFRLDAIEAILEEEAAASSSAS